VATQHLMPVVAQPRGGLLDGPVVRTDDEHPKGSACGWGGRGDGVRLVPEGHLVDSGGRGSPSALPEDNARPTLGRTRNVTVPAHSGAQNLYPPFHGVPDSLL
jgi:hypothetical protein